MTRPSRIGVLGEIETVERPHHHADGTDDRWVSRYEWMERTTRRSPNRWVHGGWTILGKRGGVTRLGCWILMQCGCEPNKVTP